MQILKAIGVLDDDDAPGSGKKSKRRGGKMPEAELGLDSAGPDMPGTLGAKLEDLGKSLLTELNAIAARKADEERLSTRSSQGVASGTKRGAAAGGTSRLAATTRR